MRNQYIFYLILFVNVFFSSCNDDSVIEIKESKEPAHYFISSQSALFSTVDCFLDLAVFADEFDIINLKHDKVIGSVNRSLVYIDYVSNGVEVMLDFGPLGNDFPKGRLGADGKYRSGILKINITFDPHGNWDSGILSFVKDAPFTVGDGETYMVLKEGFLRFNLSGNEQNVLLQCRNIKILSDEKIFHFGGDLNIELPNKIEFNVGEILSITGEQIFKIGEGIEAKVKIVKPLEKPLNSDCISYFNSGKLLFQSDIFANDIHLLFNPNQLNCEGLVEVTLSGKSSLFYY
jgi:hypothetical protein